MATVSEIVERVDRRVIDLPAAVAAEVEKLVSEGHRAIQRRHNFRVMRGLVNYTTTVGDPILGTLPSDARVPFVFRDDPYRTDEDGHTSLMKAYVDRDDVFRAFGTDATLHDGTPRAILLAEDSAGNLQFETYPIPDGLALTASGEYDIYIPYWKTLPFPASASSDWFTDNAEEYLVFRATGQAFFLNWAEERGAFWMGLANNEMRELIREDKLASVAHSTTMPYYTGAHAPRVMR